MDVAVPWFLPWPRSIGIVVGVEVAAWGRSLPQMTADLYFSPKDGRIVIIGWDLVQG